MNIEKTTIINRINEFRLKQYTILEKYNYNY